MSSLNLYHVNPKITLFSQSAYSSFPTSVFLPIDLHASRFTTQNSFALHYVNIEEHVCVPKKINTDYTEAPLYKANTTV